MSVRLGVTTGEGEMVPEPDGVVVSGGVRDPVADALKVTGAVKLPVEVQEWVFERV